MMRWLEGPRIIAVVVSYRMDVGKIHAPLFPSCCYQVCADKGHYFENLNYKGKAITIASYFLIDGDSSHIDNTIIDGSRAAFPDTAYVIYFVNDEDSNSVLLGFTLKNKMYTFVETGVSVGGGVFILDASSLYFTPDVMIKQGNTDETKYSEISIEQINIIKIRRKGRILKGALIGALSGIVIGVTAGFIAEDDPAVLGGLIYFPGLSAGAKALTGGWIAGLGGAAIGAIIGSIKIKIPINGSQEEFVKHRKKLKQYSVK
jgi:hypothetical protein